MYRVSTGDARTDLYGIGKGAAQVLDLSPMRDNIRYAQQEEAAKKELEAKQQKAREDDIMTNLYAASKVAIMPKDRDLIAGKTQATRDFVVNNIDKLRKGDAEATMQYQNLAGDLLTSAEMSKNFREVWEQRGLDLQKNGGQYRPGVLDQHLSRAATEDAGNWNIDDSIYKKNINYNDRVIKDLSNYAQKAAQDSPTRKVFTLKQAEDLIATDLEDPELFDQAVTDFEAAKDKLGATDPVSFYKKRYAPKLTIDDTKVAPEFYYGGGSDKTPKIRAGYNKVGDGRGVISWEYSSPPDNPYITTSIGDVKPGQIFDEGDKTYMEVTTKPDSDGNYEKKKLGYEETAQFVHNKLGTTINELREGKAPGHIDLKYKDVTKSAEAGHKAAEATRSGNKPKKGDERKVQGGIAVYDGTKWVMKK